MLAPEDLQQIQKIITEVLQKDNLWKILLVSAVIPIFISVITLGTQYILTNKSEKTKEIFLNKE